MTHHATAVAFGERAVLLRGPSGSGKSDLALRLLALRREALVAFGIADIGAIALIADDRVELVRRDCALIASVPDALHGLIEVRGLGLHRVTATRGATNVNLVVDLVPTEPIERMPEPMTVDIEGIALPLIRLAPFEASAPLKVALALFTRAVS
jgi:HPr kinase/phosphorylase